MYAGNTSELVFDDITADTMGLLLKWMYAGFKARLTLNQAVSLFEVSHRFDMGKLQHQCEGIHWHEGVCTSGRSGTLLPLCGTQGGTVLS